MLQTEMDQLPWRMDRNGPKWMELNQVNRTGPNWTEWIEE